MTCKYFSALHSVFSVKIKLYKVCDRLCLYSKHIVFTNNILLITVNTYTNACIYCLAKAIFCKILILNSVEKCVVPIKMYIACSVGLDLVTV